jgi:hypothetical protein
MIYEFALDPILVAKWHDRLEYLYFEEKFGVHTRRIPSIYPKDWKDKVLESVDGELGDIARKKLEVILLDVLNTTIKRPSTFPELGNWLERAEKENIERPFRAVLSLKNPNSNPSVIESGALIEQGHNLWNVPDLKTIFRTPEKIAEAVKPVLQFCKKVVFIEPYFSDKKSFLRTLEALFRCVWNYRIPGSDPIVEVQTKLDARSDSHEGNNFIHSCQRGLSGIIPSGKKIELIVKKGKLGHQRFHNRYILTDSIGIGLPFGLTDAIRDKPETDDLFVLSTSQYRDRWREYVNGRPSPFETLARNIITGSRRS